MKKSILLLNVHRIMASTLEIVGEIPGGLLCLGSWLEKNGYDPQIFSCEPSRARSLIGERAQGSSLAMIGFYCDFENQVEIQEIGSWISANFPIPVILGGPQTVGFDADFLRKAKCLAAVIGEGEITLLKLLHALRTQEEDWRRTPGIVYLDDQGELVGTGPGEILEDLDQIPLPALHLCPDTRSETQYKIMTGRGCPYSCAFCQEGATKYKARFRSVGNILGELEAAMDRDPEINYLAFTDDTFTLSLDRVRQICSGLDRIRRKREFHWYCEAHVQTLDRWPEMLEIMVRSGLVRLQIGVESASPKVLNACRKKITPAMILRVVKRAVQAGVRQIFTCFLTGAPFESPEITEKNRRFVERLLRAAPGIIEISMSPVMPYPGTEISRCPEKFDLKILDPSGQTVISDFPVTESVRMDREEIAQAQKDLVETMLQVMRQLFRDGKVPHDRILHIFRDPSKRRYFLWKKAVYDQVPFLNSYYSLMASGAVRRSRDIPSQDLPDYRPQRILELWHDVDFSEGFPCVGDYVLSPVEFELLLHATGKLDLKTVLDRVYRKFPGIYRNRKEWERVSRRILNSFEKKYWIAYAPL